MELLSQNRKIAKSGDVTYSLFNFGIPAFKSCTGLVTCPMAGVCAHQGGCYAQQGAYIWSNVAKAYEDRLQATLKDDFVAVMGRAIAIKLKTANRLGKKVVIRIHDSGDFYNAAYVNKWLEIINNFPEVQFYAYTKMVPLFKALRKKGKIPSNFQVIFSEGGLADEKIDRTSERHARVFSDRAALLAAGYADCTETDLPAAVGGNHRIGLVYHGHKSRTWVTAAA